VPDIKVSAAYDIDFCSKWVFSNGSIETVGLYRDASKLFFTKNAYTGKNPQIR